MMKAACLVLACAIFANAQDCEVDCQKPVEKCGAKTLDIVIALDDSASISQANWDKQAIFVDNFVQTVNASFAEPRFGIVTFGKNTAVQRDTVLRTLSEHDPMDTVNSVDHCTYNCGTPTDGAFQQGALLLDNQAREGVQRLFLLVTDGQPTVCATQGLLQGSPECNEELAAQLAKQYAEGIKQAPAYALVMSLGVGLEVDYQQFMKDVASQPSEMFAVPDVNDFNALIESVDLLVDRLCFYIDKVAPTCVDKKAGQKNMLTLTGKNLINMNKLTCKFFGYTTADKSQSPKYVTEAPASVVPGLAEPGSQVTCEFDSKTYEDANESQLTVVVEVTREGYAFTGNRRTFTWSADCSPSLPTLDPDEIGEIFPDGGYDEYTSNAEDNDAAKAPEIYLGAASQRSAFALSAVFAAMAAALAPLF